MPAKNRIVYRCRISPENKDYMNEHLVPSTAFENHSDFMDALIDELKKNYPNGLKKNQEIKISLSTN